MTLQWTLGQIVSHATQALGNRGDVALSDASFWANEAQRQTWDFVPHNAKEAIAISSTTSGGNRITLPSDFEEMLDLSNLSITPPQPILPTNYVLADSWTTTLGSPSRYVEFNNWLELVPSPDSSYSIQMRYRKLCSTMTALTDVPSIATKFRYPIFLKTKQLLAEHVTFDAAQAVAASSEFVNYMNALPNDRALRLREQHYLGVSIPRGNRPSRTSDNW